MAYFTKLFPVLADHETGYEIFYEVKANLRGETEQDYAGQAEVMLYLWHLPPQENSARISLERFSPMFTERDAFRFRHRSPGRSYRYIYPETVDLERVAYFFDYEFDGGLPDSACVDVTRAAD